MRGLETGIRRFCLSLMTIFTLVGLTACETGVGYTPQQSWPSAQATTPAVETPSDLTDDPATSASVDGETAPVKVGLLLPLSGKNAALGESMQRAAEMALFDLGTVNFELVPRDTKGTAEGAAAAARDAIQDGAKLIIGPIFAPEVREAQRVTQAAGVNMVAFSTDWTLANQNTFLIGFLPFDQVARIVRYSAAAGYDRVGVLSPSDTYGNAVISAYDSVAQNAGVSTIRKERLPQMGTQFPMAIRAFSDADQRSATGDAHGAPFDAVLLPLGGASARDVSRMLAQNGLTPETVKRLGTGLMDDAGLAQEPSLRGAWFAAPSPRARAKFEQRYGQTYGIKPMRLASLAYDATALAAVLARGPVAGQETADFSAAAITNPNGFAGVDGIFRFRADGLSERGLAVLEFRNGTIAIVDDAPDTFQQSAF